MSNRRSVALLCFAAFTVMGITSSVLGPSLTSLAASVGLPIADAGVLRAVQQIGSVVATFGGGYLLNRYGLRVVLIPSLILMTAGLLGVVGTGLLAVTLCGSLLLGVGTGALNVAANVAVGSLYAENASPVLSALHTCFGVGLFLGPLLAGQTLKNPDNWRTAYVIPAIACLILSFLLARMPVVQQNPNIGSIADKPSTPHPAIRWLPLVPLITLLFLYNGAGSGIGDWIAPHVQLVANADPGSAAQVASIYGLALTAGRAIGVFALQRFGNMRVLGIAITLAVLGAAIILLGGATILVVSAGVALVGLGFSPIYPTVIAMSIAQQPENRGAVTGIVAGIASFGGIIVPVIQGWVGAGHSGGMTVTLVAAILMIVALVLVYRADNAERAANQATVG